METKEVTNQFALQDYLGYLFPGITSTLGIYLLLLLTPLHSTLASMEINLIVGILVLVLSYVIGILSSGLSKPIVRLLYKWQRLDEPRDRIPIPEYRQAIIDAFVTVFGLSTTTEIEWSRNYFLLCRALVHECMPSAGYAANRQNSLRMLREYLLVPVLIWFLVGICFGVSSLIGGFTAWGIVLIAISIVLTLLVIVGLVNKMYGNRKREVRTVLMAFLAGYQQGLFNR